MIYKKKEMIENEIKNEKMIYCINLIYIKVYKNNYKIYRINLLI